MTGSSKRLPRSSNGSFRRCHRKRSTCSAAGHGEAGRDSDFDLLVVVSDDTPPDKLRLSSTYRLTRGSGVPADVIACRRRWFERNREQVGTLGYKAVNEGRLVYGQ